MALTDDFHLTHTRHTGNILPHYHTSYPVLVLLTLLMGMLMIAVSFVALAGPPQTQSGAIQLSGLVPGPPPSSPPTIEAPTDNQRFTSLPVAVQGSCISTFTVVVERGGIPVGSVICDADGRYYLEVDLLAGPNILTVRQYDLLNQSSPISPAVRVYYDLPQPAISLPAKSTSGTLPSKTQPTIAQAPQLIVITTYLNKPVFPNVKIQLPIEIRGGVGPFAASIDWGDGKSDLFSQEVNGSLLPSHAYSKAGNYTVKISVTDKNGQKAHTQTAVTVNGAQTPITGVTHPGGNLLIAWPIYVVMCSLVFGFWLGEKHDASRWRDRQQPAQ